MALKLPLETPFGFSAPDGYRRVSAIAFDELAQSVEFGVIDYRDEVWRRKEEGGLPFNPHKYQIGPVAQDEREQALPAPRNRVRVVKVESAPAYAEFMGRTLASFLAGVGPETTLRDLIGAVKYGFAKTRSENAAAVDA